MKIKHLNKHKILNTDQARTLTEDAIDIYVSSEKITNSILAEKYILIEKNINEANDNYKNNDFGSFWNGIESIVIDLYYVNSLLKKLEKNNKEYLMLLEDETHNFPPLLSFSSVPDMNYLNKKMLYLVHLGKDNFEFGKIWEQRKMRNVFSKKRRNLNESVYSVGDRISLSLEKLQFYSNHKVLDIPQTSVSNAVKIYVSSKNIINITIGEKYNKIERSIEEANNNYKDNAFSPFWDGVESIVIDLYYINSLLMKLEKNNKRYLTLINNKVHDFPPLLSSYSISDMSLLNEKMLKLVRLGQTNFEFATIWEQRKTRDVLIEGFSDLNEAVYNVGNVLLYSLEKLSFIVKKA